MEERINDLYYNYLKQKLDLIFDFECSDDKVFDLGVGRYEETKPKAEVTTRVEEEDYGPHGDYARYHFFINGKEVDCTSNPNYHYLGDEIYYVEDKLKKMEKL